MSSVFIIILIGFGWVTEITMSRPEHNIQVAEQKAKIKAERKARSISTQVIIYDRMDVVDGHYLPTKDTIYFYED